MRSAAILLTFVSCACAGEYAVLANGNRLRADRHELEGGKVRLFNKDGVTELDASLIAGFEQEDYVAPKSEAAPGPAGALPSRQGPRELVDAAAEKYGLPKAFVRSVAGAESAFQP